jgi:hypothetical protein
VVVRGVRHEVGVDVFGYEVLGCDKCSRDQTLLVFVFG